MSEAIEKTAAGAVRNMFGALGFILLMVGVEGMIPRETVGLALGAFLVLFGVVCFFLAALWTKIRNYITPEGDRLISNFSKNPVLWGVFGVVFFQACLFLPFIEQHRWPFSYPSDPAVYTDNERLKTALKNTQNDAAKWRFSYNLRNGATASNGGRIDCKYILALSPSTGPAWHVWQTLQPMLDLARWDAIPEDARTRGLQLRHGIAISVGTDAGNAFACGTSLSRVASEAFPDQNVTLETKQITAPLIACKNECVELDVGD